MNPTFRSTLSELLRPFAAALLVPLVSASIACDPALAEDADGGPSKSDVAIGPVVNGSSDAGTDATTSPDGEAGRPDSGTVDGAAVVGDCPTTFRYVPPSGKKPNTVTVAGEWNGFKTPGLALTGPDGEGAFVGRVSLAPGLLGYKVIVDGNWELDPGAHLRKYVGGVENSAVRVADCHVPTLALAKKTLTRASAGAGAFSAEITFAGSVDGAAVDASSVVATLKRDGVAVTSPAPTVDASTAPIKVSVAGLPDGKYSLFVTAKDAAGKTSPPLRLVFWVEKDAFEWRDATIYMAMIDRFRNGEPSNDPARVANVEARADFQGGDLQGLRAAVADGTFDRMGIRAIWLSPFNTNPAGSYVAADGVHQVTGYHGYWPTKAREVDPRIGGAAALKAFVAEAHAHGIRVLQDFVVNHVHSEHEYFKAHPEWFRTGCVCGTNGCDWTEKRLECLFANYLPDVNWSVTDVSEKFSDDAVWWLDAFDIDGLRVDAVKHVEDSAVMNLSTRVREEFEATGYRVFLTGETAMGWSDCGLACNADQYGTISRYIGPWALDGQFDFVLYHAVPVRVFAKDLNGFLHVDYWTQQSQLQYPAGAIMTAYIGSHDTARFTTFATYRNQSGFPDDVPGRQWDNVAAAPVSGDTEPYARHALAMTWLMTIPGAPLVYYGDEYGDWGGADPNNRRMWRPESGLSTQEATVLGHVRALGSARKELPSLRRGTYTSLGATEDTLAFARKAPDSEAVIVALSRNGDDVDVAVPSSLSLPDGTVLTDRIGGGNVTVTSGRVRIPLGARASAVYAR
ncbi:MAG: alpha-amylase family glycosyl hydrolase [Polyangiaceae bacterium]